MVRLLCVLAACLLFLAPARAERLDEVPRTAIMSAFAPELVGLLAATRDKRMVSVHGVDFTLGLLAGRPVVLVLSGVSMVNAAMTTQMLLDRFQVDALLFSGIAGGLDAGLHIGDVAVPRRWGQFLESHFVRQDADGTLRPVPWASLPFPAHGAIQPSNAYVRVPGRTEPLRKFWFEADAALMDLAGKVVPGVKLDRCAANKTCLDTTPRALVGGDGVSGPAFVDNEGWRAYLNGTIGAQVVDMESAAVALVAEQNGIPFIAFRSVSDLAGADPDENRMHIFMALAASNAARVLMAFLAAMPPALSPPPVP
ncbi:5'-methylthioadenosine/S-adenosylhomocysteine nucleosidase [Niveispirillum fermenti]|uniref:5'-methylthioadenosine/S-adenosylhomocysteine nucleosidase n=1 Tax=Niveispirillum fermenti TaxID=1233113 RepID=UPI003A8A8C64